MVKHHHSTCSNSFTVLRREARMLWPVLLLALFASLLHPLAEAKAIAAGNGAIICTSFGVERVNFDDLGARDIASENQVAADELPHCTLCCVATSTLGLGNFVNMQMVQFTERFQHDYTEIIKPNDHDFLRPPPRGPPFLDL